MLLADAATTLLLMHIADTDIYWWCHIAYIYVQECVYTFFAYTCIHPSIHSCTRGTHTILYFLAGVVAEAAVAAAAANEWNEINYI